MKVNTYEEKVKWIEDNARYVKCVNDKFQVTVSEILEGMLQDAIDSPEWKRILGRKKRARSLLIKDVCALVYDLLNYEINKTPKFRFAIEEEFESIDLSKIPFAERRLDMRFDENLNPSGDTIRIRRLSESQIRDIKEGWQKQNSGDDSKRRKTKRITMSQDILKDIGYKQISIRRIREYYDNDERIKEVLSTLDTPYTDPQGKLNRILRVEICGEILLIRFNPALTTDEHTRYTIDRESFATAYRNYVKSKWEKMINDPVLSGEYSCWLEMTYPTTKELLKILKEMIGKDFDGKEITRKRITPKTAENEASEKYIWIEDQYKSAKSNLNINKPVKRSWNSKGIEYSRHYSPYNLLPKLVRTLVRWNGKPLVWIDVNGCHFLILLKMFADSKMCTSKELPIVNDILSSPHPRKRLAELSEEKDAGWFKTSLLAWINCEAKLMYAENEELRFKTFTIAMNRVGLGKFVAWLVGWKKRNYLDISRKLLTEESRMMDRALLEVWKRGIVALGCHDGIDCDPERVDEVRGIIEASFALDGYPCSLKDDRDQKSGTKAA